MATTHSTGSGTTAAGGAPGAVIMAQDIDSKETLSDGKVRVTLKSGEVVEGKMLPDGRIIRGAGTGRDSG